MTLPRVVILGGGVGGMTTAFALSKPGWEQRFASITLYQQGWRLGGKGASGRGIHQRIEEHGLHIWFGFYENAFRMMRECHEELDALAAAGEPRWPMAFKSVEESFRACNEITLTDHDGCDWKWWVADFFETSDDTPWATPDPRLPGERPDDWSVVFYASRSLHLAADLLASLVRSSQSATIVAGSATLLSDEIGMLEDDAAELWADLSVTSQNALRVAADALDGLAEAGAELSLVWDAVDIALRALDFALDVVRGRADELIRHSDTARRVWYVVDLFLAIARGLIEDDVISEGFQVINDAEFCDWLRSHGASRETVDCALVRTVVYDLAFAYRKGDPQRPAAEAGTALHGLLRSFFTYRGAIMWKMNAGMGDVVFAPLYELLIKRGVDVEFFHRVEDVRAKNGRIEEIEIDVQVDVDKKMKPANYLFDKGVGIKASNAKALWPSKPTVTFTKSSAAKAKGTPPADYESWLAGRAAARVSTTTLTHGAAKNGFDLVVFALPIGCVPHVASGLVAASPRWKAAVDHIETVPTQAMQLWLDQTATQLAGMPAGIVAGGYTEPYDTWADMVHLVDQEAVPGAVTVAYFCNVLADSPLPPRGASTQWRNDQLAFAKAHAKRFLHHDIGYLWPGAIDPLTRAFHWERLIDPSGSVGEARLDAQYVRVNVEPSERYVLSVPGSSAHRIAPGDTDFDNLYVAGDWTACGLNAGCVEAAAMSGLLAANAIHTDIGAPAASDTIVGYTGP
jgi:uncharacterized protein with NAD-binding domain and iron-sulfur cluster